MTGQAKFLNYRFYLLSSGKYFYILQTYCRFFDTKFGTEFAAYTILRLEMFFWLFEFIKELIVLFFRHNI